MPERSKKTCPYPGCGAVIPGKERHCTDHQAKRQEQRAESQRHYDQTTRDPQVTAFYKSAAWEAARKQVLIRDHGLCQPCWKDGRLAYADLVHHIEEVKVNWGRRLDLANLVSICHACHNQTHGKHGR